MAEFEVNAMAGIIDLVRTFRLPGGKGDEVKDLTIVFKKIDTKSQSKRGETLAQLLRLTPNLVTLDLQFSGYMNNAAHCLGEELVNALSTLKSLEHFSHHSTSLNCTNFGGGTLLKLVSSWPKLRTLYIAGDMKGGGYVSNLPPATCALECVTFERLISYDLGPMFAGSAHSLRHFEAWSMCGSKMLEDLLRPVLPGIESITIEHSYPSKEFIMNELSAAPRLETFTFKGDFHEENAIMCQALSEAIGQEGSFPSLTNIAYPGDRQDRKLLAATKLRGNIRLRGSDAVQVAGWEGRSRISASGRNFRGRRWAPY